MKELLNSEYLFTLDTVELTLYINYKDKTYDIQEPGQEGVFYGTCKDIPEGLYKAQLLCDIMEFVGKEFFQRE
jgi:hypothetical protein